MVAMKKALFTSAAREIRQTLSRFMSIFLIVALGTGFFAGVKATSPDMLLTIDRYFDDNRLADLRIVSTMGLDEDDLQAIRNTPGVLGVMPAYTADVLTYNDSKQLVLRLHSLPLTENGDDTLNRLTLVEGRLPTQAGECVAEVRASINGGYQIGDVITVESGGNDPIEDMLAVTEFTVVGLISSPYYITFERGTSSVGSGSVDRYLYVPEQDFTYPVYTDAFVAVSGALEAESYKKPYTDLIDAQTEEMKTVAALRERQRYEAIVSEATEELDKGRQELADAKQEADQKLADARAELDDARNKLNDGRKEYQDGVATFQTEIADAQKKLTDGEKELADGWREYYDGLRTYERESASANEKLAAAQKQIDAGLAEYKQGLAVYKQALQTHTALSQAFAVTQNPESDLEQRQTALATISGIAAALGENEDTAQLAQVLAAFAADPGNPMYSYAAQAALEGFGTTLTQTKQTLDGAKAELDAAQRKVSAGYAALSEAAAQLQSARLELEDAQKTLEKGKTEFAEKKLEGEQKLDDARRKLEDGERELASGELEYQDAEQTALRELADAQQEIDDAQKKIDDLSPPEWYILSRESFPGNAGYYDDSNRIDAIAQVFPVFFFLVAALVCLTTMTRMVEEKRTELGTVKALGYGKGAAVFKFLFYSGLASLLGSATGLIIGFQVFPYVIGSAYGILYHIPPILTPFHWDYAIPTALVAVIGTMLAALLACYKELAEQPATLMRPKAPKPGKRVLLERVPIIWRRLGFTQKVTVRNLLRYKRRMLMTVIGIAGCTALMVAGFGLKNSIAAIGSRQYGDIFLYHGMVLLNQDKGQNQKDLLANTVAEQQNITGSLSARQETVTALSGNGGREYDAVLFVPESTERIGEYASLRTRAGQDPITLGSDGAVITEKLARLLTIQPGDTITLRDADNHPYDIRVAAVTENYVFHYIYLSSAQYERVFEQSFEPNTLFLLLSDSSDDAQDALARALIANDYVVSVSFNSSAEKSFYDMLSSLDYVVLVLIISAGLLAFVVLYNLTNINVTERLREIATIKVLGFYDAEVSSYVYRENILLSLMGIAFGLLGGVFLHSFVVQTGEIDMLMFGREIGWLGFTMAALLTALFTLLVNLTLHRRLKHISMVESLKSVE